jgi:hypothetical protein
VAQQVTPSQIKRLASPEDRSKIDATLREPGMGVALFSDSTGDMTMLMSFGTFKAELPGRYPPGACGDLALAAWCPPGTSAADEEKISPVKRALQNAAEQNPSLPTRWAPPSQIRTEFPGEHGRSSPLRIEPEPAPDRRAILQEREPVEKPPANTEADSWWDRALGPKRR